MPSIGLHLTKCAGTSLVTDLRRKLSDDEYYLASSFYENILAARPDFWEIANLSELRFIFGHYVHECMFPCLKLRDAWSFFLFTGFRDPHTRLISQYNHVSRVTGVIQDPKMFVESYGSSMCDEILRAFPSFESTSVQRHEAAARALTCFNYIYSSEAYSETIGRIYDSLELPLVSALLPRDNVNSIPTDAHAYEVLTESLRSCDDVRLYTIVERFIGQDNFGISLAEVLGVACDRENWFSKIMEPHPTEAMQKLYDYHLDVMGYELSILPSFKRNEAMDILHTRYSHLGSTINYLNTRKYE